MAVSFIKTLAETISYAFEVGLRRGKYFDKTPSPVKIIFHNPAVHKYNMLPPDILRRNMEEAFRIGQAAKNRKPFESSHIITPSTVAKTVEKHIPPELVKDKLPPLC